MTSPPADTSGVQEPVHSFGDLLHRWQKCIFTRQFCAITSAAAPSQKTVPSNNRVFLELLNDGKSEAARNTVADRPNVPKRLDGCELNSHKRGQTCAHSCPPTLPHPLYLSNLHLVTQHTIQGLLLVAWDELLDEWVAFYRGCPSVLSSAKGRDTDDELERSEHVSFFWKGVDENIKDVISCCNAYSTRRLEGSNSKDQEMWRAIFPISDINLSYSGRPEDPLSLQSGLASVGDTGV